MTDTLPLVFIAADVDPVVLALLGADGRFRLRVEPSYDEASLLARIAGAEVLVTRYHNEVTGAVLRAADALRLIVQGTSGLDNIDADAAASRGIEIRGIPGENANAVAELVIGQLISLTRTLGLYDRMVREGRWERADCATRRELRSWRLGIVGLGRVGSRLAALARAFGVAPRAFDPYLTEEDFRQRGAERVEHLDTLLASSDIVSFHVPLTDETRGMLGARELELVPRGAIVVNASRGGVVDIPAVLGALAAGRIGGAALDVFDREPPQGVTWPDDPRLLLTPHIAGCSRESKESIGRLIYLRICEFYRLDPRT